MATAHRKQLEASNKAKAKARDALLVELADDPSNLKSNAKATLAASVKTASKKS